MAKSASLTAQQLRYRLGERRLIHDVSLSIASGEMVAIIGPNGAGKSTLLRLLTGYLQPDCGECRLLERPLELWTPEQLARVRAVMRQHSELAFPFSVEEVVAMGRAPHGMRDAAQAVQAVMAQTDCLSLAARWLFLDEPTSALDLYHQQHTLRLLHDLTRRQPLAVCCVLHDLNLAALYADRILLLHQGRLVADGTPAEVLQAETLTRWYQADLGVMAHPESATPQVYLRR